MSLGALILGIQAILASEGPPFSARAPYDLYQSKQLMAQKWLDSPLNVEKVHCRLACFQVSYIMVSDRSDHYRLYVTLDALFLLSISDLNGSSFESGL